MGIMRNIFGPNKEEVWRNLCAEIGADFVAGSMWKGDKVRGRVGEWTITLDSYTTSNNNSHQTYTRLRAPFVNADGFRFEIYRKSIFSGIGKMLGMQDIEVGHLRFDEDFIIKGNDVDKLRALFKNQRIRELIDAQRGIHFMVKDDEGWFGEEFPDGVDELYFVTSGLIKDVERLKQLYELFAETLNHLCHIGSAYDDDPQLVI